MAYRLFGAETSAYSTKLRSYLRYKGVEHDWRPRNQESEEEFSKLARFPTLPVLVTAGGFAVHDTTPLIEALEADQPEPSATPADPVIGFLACVLEEYGDTWLSKAVFHYRWTRKKDQRAAAQRAMEEYYTKEMPEDRKSLEDAAIVRMLGELKAVGLEGEFGAVVEKSFKRFVKLLDDHLRRHLFLFGGQPSIADFAIAGQLIQLMKDPTPAKIIEKDGEFVAKWCAFMAEPKASGPYESLENLIDTLSPIFASELAAGFLPWAAENLESSLASRERFEVTLGKDVSSLAPLRSAARSFRELRRKFVTGQQIEALKAFTDATETTVYLLRPQLPPRERAVPVAEPVDENDGEPTEAGADGEAQPRDEGERSGGRKKRRRRRRRGGREPGEAGESNGEGVASEGASEAAADAEGESEEGWDNHESESEAEPDDFAPETSSAEAAEASPEDPHED
jgi:glutathione S-transferase